MNLLYLNPFLKALTSRRMWYACMDYYFYNALRHAIEDYKTDQRKNIRAVVCDLKFPSIMKQTTAISKKEILP